MRAESSLPADAGPGSEEDDAAPAGPPSDDAIRAIVARLARPHPTGHVIERAAILAEGPSSTAIVEWIVAHRGRPETVAPAAAPRGLYGDRSAPARGPVRYLLPAGALSP